MTRRPKKLFVLPFLIAIGLASGCAGKPEKVGGTDHQELPKDMQEKFEVKETAVLPPAIDPVPATLTKVVKKEKKKKVAKVKEVTQVSKVAFVYPHRRPAVEPIWVGEKLTLDVSWLGLSAGEATLETLPFKSINDRKVYHIKGTALNSKLVSLIYGFNDTIETFMDFEGLFSHRFHTVLDESAQSRDCLELYDSEKQQTYFWSRWNHKKRGYSETKQFFPMTPLAQDSLSALYYIRTLPLKDGGEYFFPVVSEGKTWEGSIKVIRREVIDTPLGKMKTIVVKPETKYQGILQKTGDSFVWLTDDDRHYLVHLEAKIKIGYVVANIMKVEPGEKPH